MATIIVAYDAFRVIGCGNKIPWHIPKDLSLFKKRTMGQAVIMGRKTFDSIPEKYRPLPGRKNIVLTRQSDRYIKGVTFTNSLLAAIELARGEKLHPYIIGGATIYQTALKCDLVDKIIASEVQGGYKGDVYFPKLNVGCCRSGWSRKVIDKYEQFTIVEFTRWENVVKQIRKTIVSLRRQVASYQRKSHNSYKNEQDYLPYEECDR